MFLDHFHQPHQFQVVPPLGLGDATPAQLRQRLEELSRQRSNLRII
jgi:hypothetical protein